MEAIHVLYLATPHHHVALATSLQPNSIISVAFPSCILPRAEDSTELAVAPAIHLFGGLPLIA